MGALLTLLVIVTASLVAVRVGSTALMMTGLSWDTASFQSYSAFFGVGFTTKEAELVVDHPVRRRIIRYLIFVGNVGLTSALATLVVTFVQIEGTKAFFRTIGWIVGGLVGFGVFAKLGPVRRLFDWSIRKALVELGAVRALDYESLLHVHSGFVVSEVEVLEGSPLAGKTLRQSRPGDVGIVVLGIERPDGAFVGAPGPEDRIEIGDTLTVYGREETIRSIAAAS